MDWDEIERLARDAQADAKHLALESLSDEDIPLSLHSLSLAAQAETGQRVTAIKRGTKCTYEPSRPVKVLSDWHFRRLLGKLRPHDPEAVEVEHCGFYLIVAGNPVIVEGWLKKYGFSEASAGSATAVYVCDEADLPT